MHSPVTLWRIRGPVRIVAMVALPLAGAIIALVYGGMILRDAVAQISASITAHGFGLAAYAFLLTHLTVGLGLLAGATMSLEALLRGSNRVMLAGQLLALACVAGVLAMQSWALWDPV